MLKVEKERVVSLTYELRVDKADGKVIESLDKGSPLTFLFGTGNLLPKFESNISGLKVGDEFDFDLACEDAYGEINTNAIIDLPIHVFEINGQIDENMLQIGNSIPMQDNSGNRLNGIVREVSGDKVKMDFNHPMAGSHLFFKGEITEIREATAEEMSHGHIHGNHSCDGCSDCGDGGHCH
ncbi:MAG: peptidylprolyl isomerase [Bacteroidales bacterium]|nr:peptidylprolyl isomerase [Bacteroidales bacterium]